MPSSGSPPSSTNDCVRAVVSDGRWPQNARQEPYLSHSGSQRLQRARPSLQRDKLVQFSQTEITNFGIPPISRPRDQGAVTSGSSMSLWVCCRYSRRVRLKPRRAHRVDVSSSSVCPTHISIILCRRFVRPCLYQQHVSVVDHEPGGRWLRVAQSPARLDPRVKCMAGGSPGAFATHSRRRRTRATARNARN